MAWQEPRLDWTADDYWNAEDADRVEGNTEALQQLMAAKFPPAPSLVTKTGRTTTSIDYASDLNRIEGNIDALRQAFVEPPGWEPMRTDWQAGQPFDWRDARRLEGNLARLHQLVDVNNPLYCGTFRAGEEVIR